LKRLVFTLIFTALITSLPLATGQDNSSQLKHLMVPSPNRNRSAYVSAVNIERGVEYPSVLRLKGSVEIKMPVCLRTDPGDSLVCDGYVIVRADAADMHEDTGAIEAHGDTTVTPTRF
jgi:hypothetical protein